MSHADEQTQPRAALDALLIPGTDEDVRARYHALAEASHDATLSLIEDDVVVVDTETTGLDPAYCSLIEIAALRMNGPNIVERFQTFVNPGCSIPEEITELTGITNADIADAPSPREAVAAFAQFAGGCDLVAHNAPFDRGFVMRRAEPGALPGAWIDTLALSQILLPRLKSHRLVDLAAAFGAHPSTHRATDDTEALAALWRILVAALQSMPAGLAGFIAELSPETDWPLRKLFAQAAGAQPGVGFSLRVARRERTELEGLYTKYDANEVPLFFDEDEQVEQAFAADGIAGRMYPGYEPRSEQVEMALEVQHAFRDELFSVLEAGTGVGKSMAYLLPAARAAKGNAITIGVATKTNALMDQLVYHELPRLSDALGGLTYIALKGYDHYPCLRKLERFAREDEPKPVEVLQMIATLYHFVSQTTWGDLDALNIHWYGLPRDAVRANLNDCLKQRCPFYSRCYLHGARRFAKSADIVVTNHALLFRSVQMDNGILPPIRHWVIDEAHTMESEARKQLSHSVSARDLELAFNRLTGAHGGLIAKIRRAASQLEGGNVLYGVTADVDDRVDTLRAVSGSFFAYVKELESGEKSNSAYSRTTLWISPALRQSGSWANLYGPGRSLMDKLEGLTKRLRDLMSMLEQFEGAFDATQADLSKTTSNLDEMLFALNLVLEGEDDSYVYSAELDRDPERVAEALTAAKLDIGETLANDFYSEQKTVVFTSATLGTGGSDKPFAHFLRTSGLALVDKQRVRTRQLNSSYDFEHHMSVLLPDDMPEPNQAAYRGALKKLLLAVHTAMGGSVLTLFTNRREMESLYHELKPQLKAEGIELIAQTRGTSTKNLRDRFLQDEALCLFALKSFWEGFDAPGETLRCVVIPKLPFGRPTDPIAQEREARESRAAWGRYSLPEAIMDLKQAAGRLIRTSTDSGWLILADARLQTKGYGKSFLHAMPTTDIREATTEEIAEILATQDPGRPS